MNDIIHVSADDVVYKYFSNNHVSHKDLDIDIIDCWFHLFDNKFEQKYD